MFYFALQNSFIRLGVEPFGSTINFIYRIKNRTINEIESTTPRIKKF